MAKPKLVLRALDSYTVKHIGKVICRGDCVLMRPSNSSKPSYVARLEQIEADGRGENVRVQVRWYYRPEESIGGRRQFHGSKEVFLSDHFDIQSADTIEGKCTVHSFKSYTKLDAVGNDDYFCRFEYNSSTGAFNPDRVAVYCKCEMPYNPDDLMIQCEGCSDWFHPTCVEVNPEEAERLDHFYCLDCSPENKKKLQNSRVSTRETDVKVSRLEQILAGDKSTNNYSVGAYFFREERWIQNADAGDEYKNLIHTLKFTIQTLCEVKENLRGGKK